MDIFVGSDNLITLTGLKDELTGLYDTTGAAVLIGALFLASDESRASQIGSNIAFDFVVASNGNFTAIAPNTLLLTPETDYILYLTITWAGKITVVQILLNGRYKNEDDF